MAEFAAVGVLFAVALLGNVPLGFLRRRSPRWSLLWFIGCDGSVPVLWLMRHQLGVNRWAIIPEVLLALAGNIYGPRLVLWWRARRARAADASPAAVAAGAEERATP